MTVASNPERAHPVGSHSWYRDREAAAAATCGSFQGRWKCQKPAGHDGRHGTIPAEVK